MVKLKLKVIQRIWRTVYELNVEMAGQFINKRSKVNYI